MVGVRTHDTVLGARVVIDATGYRSVLLKQAGLDPGIRRFGVGAEYDMYAPHCDEREAVLLVGGEFAPSGYAWVFPWGRHRVRVGVGIIHPDSDAKPDAYLDALVAGAGRFGVDLRGAQPLEHHAGLIPSECFAARFAGDGILGVGDAAGQASSLLGEGIRWAIHAGKMAGEVAAGAIAKGDVSRAALAVFERQWTKRYGKDLRLAHKINQRIAGWDDRKWDERLEVLKLLTPDQFVEASEDEFDGRLAAAVSGAESAGTGGGGWDIIGATYEKTTFTFAFGFDVRRRSGGIPGVEIRGLEVHQSVREAGGFRQSQRASDVPR